MSELGLRKRIALEAAAQISRNIRKEHPLRQLFWECTLRCNVSCRHCGSDCRKLSEVRDMPREDFLRVLDSIARKTDPHQVFVTITGGEPLLREDLEQCGRAIFERGFPWGLVTNGLALTPERFEALHKAGMHSITVSMDGLEDNLFVQYPQINTDVVTCVNQRNYQELPLMRDYLVGKGIGYWRIYSIFPVGRAASDPMMQISNEQYRGMFDFIRQTRQEGRINASYGCEGFLGRYEGEVRDMFFDCQLCQHTCRLSSRQYLRRRLHGRMGEPLSALSPARMDAQGRLQGLSLLAVLQRQRHASARWRGSSHPLPSETNTR